MGRAEVVDDCYCGRQPRCVALKFAHSRLQRFDAIPKHQDQVGNGLGIALGEGDEWFAGWTIRKHEYYTSL